MTSDWVDDLLEAEPGIESDRFTEGLRDEIAGSNSTLEEYWSHLDDRGQQDGRFRLTKDGAINCLGRTLRASIYAEAVNDHSDISANIYFRWEDSEVANAHVTPVIDGEEYGLEGVGKPNNVPADAISDLYKVGLGVKMIDGDPSERNELMSQGLGYEQLEEWGKEIRDKYSEKGPGPNSEYLEVQGMEMEQEAKEANSDYENDIFIA